MEMKKLFQHADQLGQPAPHLGIAIYTRLNVFAFVAGAKQQPLTESFRAFANDMKFSSHVEHSYKQGRAATRDVAMIAKEIDNPDLVNKVASTLKSVVVAHAVQLPSTALAGQDFISDVAAKTFDKLFPA